jgi:hypothetical protein
MDAIWQLGGPSGPLWKTVGGLFQARNAADSAFVKVQGADPTVDDDLVTLRALTDALGGFQQIVSIEQEVIPNAAGVWTFTYPTAFPIGSLIVSGNFGLDLAAVVDATLVSSRIHEVANGDSIVSTALWGPDYINGVYPAQGVQNVYSLPYALATASQLRFEGDGSTDGVSGVAVTVRAVVFVMS